MKTGIFLFIGIIGFASVLSAQQKDAFFITPTEAAQDQAEESQPVFQWQNSVGSIQKTTADLLEVNQKLAEEYNVLNAEATRIEAEIARKNAESQQIQQDILMRQMELAAPIQSGPQYDELVALQKEIAQEKQLVSVLGVKLKGLESRADLLQLKIKELDLDKRALLVDQRTKQDLVALDVKADVGRLRERLSSLRAQEQTYRGKIAGLSSATVAVNDEKAVREQQALQAERTSLEKERALFVKRVQESVAILSSPEFKKYGEFVTQKEMILRQVDALKKQKALLEGQVARMPVAPPRDFPAEIKALNDESGKMDGQIGDLRENIAVLEYKINTLERYKNRNKSGT